MSPEPAEISGYDAKDIHVLRGLDGVRKRPGMYIGSTDGRGLLHCLVEIIDNSVDEAAAGHCTAIEVHVHTDGSFEVTDNGRGIPVDTEKSTGKSGLEVVFTELHAGGKFGGGGYGAAGGLHGVGASVVNALSLRLDAEVDRGGFTWSVQFERGHAGRFNAAGKFSEGTGLKKGSKLAKPVTGTRVRFWPDPTIFEPGAAVDMAELSKRCAQLSFLLPGTQITVTDHREGGSSESFCSKAGLVDLVDTISSGDAVCDVIHLTGEGSYSESVPVLVDGVLVMTDVERVCVVDVALRWSAGWDSDVRSFVNTIVTPKGGTHVTGFERALTRSMNAVLRDAKVLKDRDDNVVREDITEGMSAAVRVEIVEPQFEGQTKEVLGTSAAQSAVSQVVADGLKAWFADNARKPQAKNVLNKVANAAKARVAARAQRETVRRKNAIESSSLPAKLADCRTHGLVDSEIFLVEGDSAGGSMKAARDSEFQAMLPLRGKILNVAKATAKQTFNNAEIAALVSAVGAGAGSEFELSSARYGRVIIATDADVDGAHIRVLLLTFFYHYMRPLLEDGRIYAAVPPLFLLRSGKGKIVDTYVFSEAERDAEIARLAKARKPEPSVSRFKGLGEMSAEQLAVTTVSPDTRILRRVNISDAAAAAEMFETLMGSAVEPRREFIVKHALSVDRDTLDL